MTNDSNIDFQMNSTHNHLQKILFPITAGIILEKCFITVVLYRQVLWRLHQIVKPRPKTQTPKAQPQPSQTQSKSVPRGLGLTLKSYGPPTPPPHPTPPTPPPTFKHEGGL